MKKRPVERPAVIPSDPELDAELERRCVEDGDALSDLLTLYVEMVGVNLVDDCDPDQAP